MPPASMQPHRTVVVVGAGAAGLAAARSLHDSNIRTAVLEARPRTGGRMLTRTFPSKDGLPEIAVDIGASILHGCGDKNQYVFAMAAEFGALAPIVAGGGGYESTYFARWFDENTGYPVDSETIVEMAGLSERVCARMKKLQEDEEMQRESKVNCGSEEFLGMTMQEAYDQSLGYVLGVLERSLNETERRVLEKMFVRGFGYNSPLSRMPLSIATFSEYLHKVEEDANRIIYDYESLRKEAKIHEHLVNKCDRPAIGPARLEESGDRIVLDGYTELLTNRLQKWLDVKVNSVVREIRVGSESVELQSDSPCEVELASGEIYPCDYVVCTLPIGVLRGLSDESQVQFIPPLSASKQKAISKVSGGVHNKIVLRFAPQDVFWPSDTPQINCLDPRFQFFNLHAYKKPGILLAHIFGTSPFSVDYNNLDDEGAVREVLKVLEGMFFPKMPYVHNNRVTILSAQAAGIEKMPKPIDFVVTRWNTDPFSLGSYSKIDIGGDWSCLEELGKPEFDDRLQFAGEHCSVTGGWQCVHGAYETGIDCAIRIMNKLKIPESKRRGLCKRSVGESFSESEQSFSESGDEADEDYREPAHMIPVIKSNEGRSPALGKFRYTKEEDDLIYVLGQRASKTAGFKFWSRDDIGAILLRKTGVRRSERSYYLRYRHIIRRRKNPNGPERQNKALRDGTTDHPLPELPNPNDGWNSGGGYIEEEILEEGRLGRRRQKPAKESGDNIRQRYVARIPERKEWSQEESNLLWGTVKGVQGESRILTKKDWKEVLRKWSKLQNVQERSAGDILSHYRAMERRRSKSFSVEAAGRPAKRRRIVSNSENSNRRESRRPKKRARTPNKTEKREIAKERLYSKWSERELHDLIMAKLQVVGAGEKYRKSSWHKIHSLWATTTRQQTRSVEDLKTRYKKLKKNLASSAPKEDIINCECGRPCKGFPWRPQEKNVLALLTKWFGDSRWESIHSIWAAVNFGIETRSQYDLRSQHKVLSNEYASGAPTLGAMLLKPKDCKYSLLETEAIANWTKLVANEADSSLEGGEEISNHEESVVQLRGEERRT